ncbi:hypothetical protein DV096_15490 [Bradymonadaceae bacterium TMQ3]|uniref:Dodecin domain-containing protein n=1 Tax=Lujinxingia sediminis TaxID=2480984 RepID=A0ABY0CRI2_9DELT|nr:hypothetical protein [Lujinxingia sediminis]RDV36916.1 hypothetical protein DV096_15490 [Bradymonadaceae bacterium TMQ3]RVU43002.1 hypothetical protein EA187_14300 [Lujinxingia sediminis]TXC73039.1 hypothetical protein FRC91_16430 [Bradymonadales bacterium TMQ1]
MSSSPKPERKLTEKEALAILDEISASSQRVLNGEVSYRVQRVADRGNTAFSIRVVEVERKAR